MNRYTWQYWLLSPSRCFVVAALLLGGFIFFTHYSAGIRSVELSQPSEKATPQPITLPYSAQSNDRSRSLVYLVTIDHKAYSPVKWRIIVDDCIRGININGQPVNLFAAKGNVCDFNSGITLDLSAYLKKGLNSLEVSAGDTGGLYGFNMIPIPLLPHFFPILEGLDPFIILMVNGFVSSLSILYFCRFLRRRNVDYISIGLFILSAVVSLHYLHISSNDAWTNDIEWHLDYINYVSQHWLTPYAYSTLTSNHPPLYYYIAAATIRLNEMFIGLPDKTALRFLSWVFFLLFHSFNLLTLRRVGFSGIGYYACAAMLLLWPGNAHYASKINSEAMYYAVAAISFYYTITWYQKGLQRHLMKAVIFAGIALMVRTNAVIIFSMIGSLVLIALFRRHLLIRDFFTKEWIKLIALLMCCFLVGFGGMIFHETHDVLAHYVDNRPPLPIIHFLSLNYFVGVPFNNWDNNLGLVEYLLRTSMFGEYQWSSPELAVAMNYFVATIFWYSVLPWLFVARTQWHGMLPYVLYLLFSLVFVVYFGLRVHHLSAQDARYIYPTLICLVVLFGKSHAICTQRGAWLLGWLGPLLAAGFVSLSTYFFWNNFR